MQKKHKAIAFDELTWRELTQNHPELLRRKLENRLAKPVSVEQLAAEIMRIVKPLGRKPGSPETVARYIATALAPHFSRVSGTLQRLIANRPVELAAAGSVFVSGRAYAGVGSSYTY